MRLEELELKPFIQSLYNILSFFSFLFLRLFTRPSSGTMPSTKNIVLGLAAAARFSFALDPCSNDSDCPSGQVCGSGSNTASGTFGPAVLTCQPAPRRINIEARQKTTSCTPSVGGLDADTGCPEGQVCSLDTPLSDAPTSYSCRSITKIKRDLGVRQADCVPSVDGDDGCPEGESCVNIIGGGSIPPGVPSLAPVVYGCQADTTTKTKRSVQTRQDLLPENECAGDDDCGEGQMCVANAPITALTPFHYLRCESTDVVKRGLTPRQGSCTPSIDGDDGCPDGQSCVNIGGGGINGPILAPAIFTCQEDTTTAKAKRDLGARQTGDLDECTPSVDGDDGCAEGETCVSNRPLTIPSDALWYYICQSSAKVKRTVEARQDQCTPTIEGDDGCPDGQTCTPNRDPSVFMVAPLYYTCKPSSKAKRNLEARSVVDECTPSPDGDDGCPDGQTCVNLNGGPPAALVMAIYGCEDEAQVKRDLVERQFTGCESNADCANGQTCQYLPVSPMGDMPTPKLCMGEATKRELNARANRV